MFFVNYPMNKLFKKRSRLSSNRDIKFVWKGKNETLNIQAKQKGGEGGWGRQFHFMSQYFSLPVLNDSRPKIKSFTALLWLIPFKIFWYRSFYSRTKKTHIIIIIIIFTASAAAAFFAEGIKVLLLNFSAANIKFRCNVF